MWGPMRWKTGAASSGRCARVSAKARTLRSVTTSAWDTTAAWNQPSRATSISWPARGSFQSPPTPRAARGEPPGGGRSARRGPPRGAGPPACHCGARAAACQAKSIMSGTVPLSARGQYPEQPVVGRPVPPRAVNGLGPHGHGVLDRHGAGVHQGQQRQPRHRVLGAGPGGAQARLFGAAHGGGPSAGARIASTKARRTKASPSPGRSAAHRCETTAGRCCARTKTGGPGGRSRVPRHATGLPPPPRGRVRPAPETVELLGGPEFGQGRVQGAVVEFGTDQQGGAASQHLGLTRGGRVGSVAERGGRPGRAGAARPPWGPCSAAAAGGLALAPQGAHPLVLPAGRHRGVRVLVPVPCAAVYSARRSVPARTRGRCRASSDGVHEPAPPAARSRAAPARRYRGLDVRCLRRRQRLGGRHRAEAPHRALARTVNQQTGRSP